MLIACHWRKQTGDWGSRYWTKLTGGVICAPLEKTEAGETPEPEEQDDCHELSLSMLEMAWKPEDEKLYHRNSSTSKGPSSFISIRSPCPRLPAQPWALPGHCPMAMVAENPNGQQPGNIRKVRLQDFPVGIHQCLRP